jgi:hypothetical protein
MKKQASAAMLVALVIAVAVPAALADSSISITPANGSDYILPDGTVYQQNDDGTFSWIPDVATANAMGLDWSSLIPVTGLDGPVVESFPSILTLSNPSFNRTGATGGTSPAVGSARPSITPANGNDYALPDGQVYQDNGDGTCSWVPDVATGNAMGLDWNALIQIDDLSEVPCSVGTPFPHVR